MPKRLPLPAKSRMNLTDDAYARLRDLNARYGLGNHCLLVFLLEHLDDQADAESLDAVFQDFIAEYDAQGEDGNG